MSENQSDYCMCIIESAGDQTTALPADQTLLSNPKAAVLKGAKWDNGSIITCRFLGGSVALQNRVKAVAKEWEKVANLTLDFRNAGPTNVRIAFVAGKGSWSNLGTQCRNVPEPKATMNFGWLKDDSSDSVLRKVVLHEFGHAIGLIHEHQNPHGGIQWNKPAVIAELSGPPNSWDAATIEHNMFKFYTANSVVATDADALSIMMYPIPKAWTQDGFSAGLNTQLSAKDKVLVGNVYPL